MPVIDADAHVDETEDTWSYIDEAHKRYTPVTVMQDPASAGGTQPQGYNRYWCVDGRFLVRRVRDDKRTETTVETRELLDVPARLRHMDELGIDVQVCYPTTFLLRWESAGRHRTRAAPGLQPLDGGPVEAQRQPPAPGSACCPWATWTRR